MKQEPKIVRSNLTKPPKWFVVTRYKEVSGISLRGVPMFYLKALEKFDVTSQMEAILKARKR